MRPTPHYINAAKEFYDNGICTLSHGTDYFYCDEKNDCRLCWRPRKAIIVRQTDKEILTFNAAKELFNQYNTDKPPIGGTQEDKDLWTELYAVRHNLAAGGVMPKGTPEELLKWFYEEGYICFKDDKNMTDPYWLGTGEYDKLPCCWTPKCKSWITAGEEQPKTVKAQRRQSLPIGTTQYFE